MLLTIQMLKAPQVCSMSLAQMMSYLSSSSTPSQLAPDLSKVRKDLVALPSSRSNANSRNSRARKSALEAIVSKSYNTVASRPLRRVLNTNQIYHANMRGEIVAAFSSSTVANTYYALQFAVSNFASSSEYLGLFDQYKFAELEIWIEPQISQSTVMTNIGELHSCVDLDDASTPTSISTVEGKQNSLLTGTFDGHYHRWKPHSAVAIYSGAFTSFASEPAQWIDSGSPNVQHYGIKVATAATSVVVNFNIHYRARIMFRQAGI